MLPKRLFLLCSTVNGVNFQCHEASATKRLQAVLALADPYWARDNVLRGEPFSTTKEENDEATAFFAQKADEAARFTKSTVLLGETAAPELYQILKTSIVFPAHSSDSADIYRRNVHDILMIEAAFTLKARDAGAGIRDFNSLRHTGNEFDISETDGPVLKLSPFAFDLSGEDPAVSAASRFFSKYFSVEDFSLIGVKIIQMCGAHSKVFAGSKSDKRQLEGFQDKVIINKIVGYIPEP